MPNKKNQDFRRLLITCLGSTRIDSFEGFAHLMKNTLNLLPY